VVLRKTRVYPFKGALREWSGEPVLHAKVAIRVETEVPVVLMEPRSVDGLSGKFDFPALPEGRYSLLVYRDGAPDALPYAIPLETGEGAPQERAQATDPDFRRVIRVPPWALVGGRVTISWTGSTPAVKQAPGGAPKAPAVSRNFNSEPAPVLATLTPVIHGVDARVESLKLESVNALKWNDMEFPATALPPGDYQFNVQAPEPWYVVSAKWSRDQDLLGRWVFSLPALRYDKPAQFEVEIRQGGTALEGLVVNDRSEPVSGGSMCALAKDPARARQPGGAFCVRADGDGAFRSRWMSPGDWMVWAFPRKPHESPLSPAFKDKYEKRGLTLTVPENGALGRRSLVAIE
jgi:hypothetical protein